MRKYIIGFISFILIFMLASCDEIFGGDSDKIHSSSYEPVTGKYYLYEATDKRNTYENTYFDIDGKNFKLKYYENGILKKEGAIQKVVTYKDTIGKWCNNLHFNVKVGANYEHISTYTESFDPINQFRIIDEYDGVSDDRYYLSEMPYVMGTYVREGVDYKEEAPNTNKIDYITPTLENFTSALDGKFMLDEDHYFYFVSPRGWATADGSFRESYYQYYSSDLDKPIEGFARGYTYEGESSIAFRTLKDSVDWLKGTKGRINFGYSTFDSNDKMIDHFGSVDFSNGVLNSFTFEHLSEPWSNDEWDKFIRNQNYHLPDNILYDYIGGTYTKTN